MYSYDVWIKTMFHNFFEYASLWTIGIHEIHKNWGNRNSNDSQQLTCSFKYIFFIMTDDGGCVLMVDNNFVAILPIQNDHRNNVCYRLSPRELTQRISEKFSVCCVRCMSWRLRIPRPSLPACWESSRLNAKIWWFWSFDNTRISATKSFNVRNRSWKVRLMSLHES